MIELLIIIGLVLLNGFFSLSEISLVSARRTRLEEKANKENSNGAKVALDLLAAPEHLLSTVQIYITLIGVISGAFGGVALAKNVEPLIATIPALQPYAYEIAFGSVVTLITYLSLVLGELVPKSLGLTNPEGIAIALSPALKILVAITYPVAAFLSLSTKLVLKLLMIEDRQETPVSEEEVKMIIAQGVQQGVIEEKENEMIRSIFRLTDRRANAMMTSRRDVVWLDVNDPFEDIKAQVLETNHSKLPVCNGSLDHIIGILHTKNFFAQLQNQSKFNWKDLLTQPIVIPENTKALAVLDNFRQGQVYMGIVVDEYGITLGIITLHDLVESIFGLLPDIDNPETTLWTKREDGSYLIDGSMLIDELKELLHLPEWEKNTREYNTLAGFMLYHLRKVPSAGDHFSIKPYRFEVIDMDFNRIDKILVEETQAHS